MTIQTKSKSAVPRVRVSWKTYFERFCEVHGEPVPHNGRLLFRDGWRYSSTDYAGPEWGPPTSERELNGLVRAYWLTRLKIARVELKQLKQAAAGLRATQATHSLPLAIKSMVSMDGEGGVKRLQEQDADAGVYDGRIGDLEWLIDECEEQLNDLQGNDTKAESAGLAERIAPQHLG